MTRFYFDLDDGTEYYRDPQGSDVGVSEDIRKRAVAYLVEVAFETLPETLADTEIRVSVRDAEGDIALEASIAFELKMRRRPVDIG